MLASEWPAWSFLLGAEVVVSTADSRLGSSAEMLFDSAAGTSTSRRVKRMSRVVGRTRGRIHWLLEPGSRLGWGQG
jgi:hypothetical protein